jgi:protein gp37
MGQDSKIEWTTHSWSPWRGCSKVSPGCAHCYAETLSKRNPAVLGVWGPDGTRVVAAEASWRNVLAWDRAAAKVRERHRVFPSLCDPFEDRDDLAFPRARLFRLIRETPNLDWLLLTKRPETWTKVMRATLDSGALKRPTLDGSRRGDAYWWAADWLHGKPPANVWLGVSVEDQQRADERIPQLRQTPAAVRFLSVEPLLGPVEVSLEGIHWVIVGGESGPGARPMHPDWARSLRDQCQAAGVAFFFKQWGEWAPARVPIGHDARNADETFMSPDGRHWTIRSGGEGRVYLRKVGKKQAGRLLDGREWNEMPGSLATVPAGGAR